MSITTVFGLVALSITWGFQVRSYMKARKSSENFEAEKNRFEKFLTMAWWASVVVVVILAAYEIVLLYEAWSYDSLARYYLPPYNGIGYFIFYTGTRYVFGPLIAIAVGILFGGWANESNKKFGDKFLEAEEGRLFALGILLCGYPGLVLYIGTLVVAALAVTIYYTVRKKGRAPLYFLWLPASACAILITQFVVPYSLLAKFYF